MWFIFFIKYITLIIYNFPIFTLLKFSLLYFQKQNTEQNFMFILLILSEFSISAFAIPMDIISSMCSTTIDNGYFCSTQGFIHTFLGKWYEIMARMTIKCQNLFQIKNMWSK